MEKNGNENAAKVYDKEEEAYDASFKTYLWNPKTGQVMGRTGLNWAKLVIFYLIFYSCLAAFAGLNYYLFSLTLTESKPKWILGESLIGTNPGLGYRPMPDTDKNEQSTLIWYSREDEADSKFWYGQLEQYIDEIENEKSADLLNCNYNGTKATEDQSCRVDLSTFNPNACSKRNNFGYRQGDPCILLKLNRIFGWEPKGYGIEDGKYKPEVLRQEMNDYGLPEDLKKYITDNVNSKPEHQRVGFLSTVWISCKGEGITDEEGISSIQYDPMPGIPGYYFPYHKQQGYQSPFMFVQIMKPIKGSLVNVECKAWAKNIVHDRINRIGSVHFELMVD